MTTIAPPERMNREQAAEYLGLSVPTLCQDVVTHRLKLPYAKLGRRVVYTRSQLDAWLAAKTVNAVTTNASSEGGGE